MNRPSPGSVVRERGDHAGPFGRQPSACSAFITALALVLLAACAPAAERTSALVLTLDTTRADALGAWGGPPGLTPRLDALVAEGVRYERAYATVPLTLPSHASMWTGLYPVRHGVRENALWPLPEEARTAAEIAAEAGVQTAAFVASVVLDASFGLDQGFAVYRQPERDVHRSTSTIEVLGADEIVDRALAWFAERDRARPFLAWLHFYDPHESAPRPDPSLLEGRELPPEQRALWAGYLPQVALLDREIGRLLDALEADGALARTAVLVVADHGEALGEHGEASHGSLCREAVMRVPFAIRYPDGHRAGGLAREVVSVVDVLPTVLDALGLGAAPGIDGTSLWRRDAPADRGVYLESYHGHLAYGWSPLAGWVDPGGKYLHSSKPRYFDPLADPGETRDLLHEREADARRAREAMEHLARLPRLPVRAGDAPDAELLARIQDLGYAAVPGAVDELPDPTAPSDALAPEDGVALERRTVRAMKLNDRGELAAARRILREVLAANPTNRVALDQLALGYLKEERHAEAVDVLERLLASGPRWAHSAFNLGVCRLELGRFDEAVAALREAVELDGAQARDVWALVAHYERAGRPKLARRLDAALRAAGVPAEAR